jgi:alcohol dehydrogenase, propanol-preferring
MPMRAMAVLDYTEPLQLIDLPRPEVKPGYVLLRILTCGVCFSDYKTSKGLMHYSASLSLPHVPGHEICGEVVEAAPETGWQVGDVVVAYHYWPCGRCFFCQRGDEHLCINLESWTGFTHPGGFEEYLAVPAGRLIRVPEGLAPEEASTATCASGTAYRAVVTRGEISPGDLVVVLGTGGVGLMAVQFARLAGGGVIAVDIDRRKLEIASQFGVRATAASEEESTAAVAELSGGIGADVVINTVSDPSSYGLAQRLARRGGRLVGVGYYAGQDAYFESASMVLDEIEIVGSRYALRWEMERVLQLFATGEVRAVVDDVLPLEEANEAFRRLAAGEVIGRTVLQVASD